MPKLKSHSGSKKRFKITGRRKVMHKKAGARHLLQGMSSSRSRQLRRPTTLNNQQARVVKAMLPYS
jgi:large subunit ribosomal protein L35